ncbi:trafficking protein particle complex subunit 8-like isoform X2 [Haliotis cracherodii]|uniref:trafficking protein particle complex subunit 8-like isoform X2 n=1 Tax=Haliotis cracherodii TaxID=6455 RepID=UPI0039ED54BC
MAQCKQSAPEFIQNTFSPHVAVLCSKDAEVLCQKNNLTFAQLVQPFCRLGTEVHIKDPNNVSHSIHNLRISTCDMSATPPQQATTKKMLGDAVAGSQLQTGDGGRGAGNMMSVGNYDLQLHASTPWFEAYRECFLDVIALSDHEYLSHCVGCIFVASSGQSDPIATFTSLTNQQLQQQQQFPNKVPRWFCPGILTYYVLLHDVSDGELPRAEAYYQSMKTTFGSQCCHLLQINSRSLQTVENMKPEASLPDPWSQFLPKPPEVQPVKSHTPRYFITWEGVEYDGLPLQDDASFPSHLSEARLTSTIPDLENSMIETTPDVISDKISSVHSSSLTDLNETNTSNNEMLMDHPLAFHSTETQAQVEESSIAHDGDATAAANGYQDGKSAGSAAGQEKSKLRVHGVCLTTSDMDRLRIFMHEFVVRSLIPWAEKQMRMLNEQLTSRKGIHRSIFSATKKWFGTNKPSGPVQASQNTSVVYTSEAPELQLRRLADLAFLFQMYDYAYHTYHTAKRDFNNDHAWLHFAGALEMASLSIFMLGSQSQRQYPHHYMESAITTYLTTCRNFQYAIRATLVSTEALKCRGMYGEAAMQFLKMTNEVGDSDLSSALFLEQGAHCFINMKTPMVRKYAFHMILAGHRFNKAGQRKHSLRAYSQALQVFKSKYWSLAEDHIHFTIGRQSFNLKQLENASSAFKHLLMAESKQPASQQGAFLREYLFVYKQLLTQEAGENCSYGRLPELPLPNINSNTTKVLLGKQQPQIPENPRKTPATGVWFDHDESRNMSWQKLEERLVISANGGSLPNTFRSTLQCFTNNTENRASPIAFVGEHIVVEVQVEDPLQVTLVLSDVMLLWSFLPSIAGADKPQLISNEVSTGVKNNLADEIIQTTVIKEVVLEGGQTAPIRLTLVPRQPGELRVVGLAYNLGTTSSQSQSSSPLPGDMPSSTASPSILGSQKPTFISSVYVRGKQKLEVQGPRLNASKDDKTSKLYGPDRRLDLTVHEEMPILEVSFCDFPDSLLCGEVHCIEMEVRNTGRSPLHQLKVTSTHPDFFTFGCSQDLPKYPYVYQTRSVDSDISNPIDSCSVRSVPDVIDIPIEGNILRPGDTRSLPMWLRGNDIGGVHEVDFLFYYEPLNTQAKDKDSVRHRVLRHRAVVNTVESLSVRAMVTKPSACVSSSDRQELKSCIISCELENLSQVQVQRPHIQEVQVTQVSCASQDWVVNSLSISDQKDVRIGSRHILQLALKGTKCETDGNLMFSEVFFDMQKINSVQTPCCDFYFRSPACRQISSSTGDTTLLPIPSYRSAPTQPDFSSLNKAREVKLTLIILWKAFVAQENGQLKILVGQHHVCIERVDTVVTAYPLVQSNQDQPPLKFIRDVEPETEPQPSPEVTTKLVSYSFLHQLDSTHDFNKGLCIVPVTLKLQNHTNTSVDILVDTSKSSDRFGTASSPSPPQFSPGSPTPPVMSCSFSWVGPTLANLTLDPGADQQLQLKAAFCRPGVYNCNNLAVFVTYADADPSEMILQKHSTPSIITLSA